MPKKLIILFLFCQGIKSIWSFYFKQICISLLAYQMVSLGSQKISYVVKAATYLFELVISSNSYLKWWLVYLHYEFYKMRIQCKTLC